MEVSELLKTVVLKLQQYKIRFGLAGGLVANLYRTEIRATADVDIVIATEKSEEDARKILGALGYSPRITTQADLSGGPLWDRKKRIGPVCMISGGDPEDKLQVKLDLLLPEIPWVSTAVDRAQHQQIDFGFAKIPCITIEDFILSKLYALRLNHSRFKDLDDLSSIFLSNPELDLPYLIGRMQEFELPLPIELKKQAHYLLERVSRKLRC